MKSCFRYGQPIGTALVILALVETIYSSYWLLLDFVSIEQTSYINFFNATSDDFGFFGHVLWHFWIAFHFLISCIFWIAVVLEGRKYYLYTWLILGFIHNAILLAFLISQSIFRPPDSPVTFYCSIAFFILWRCYTMSVACQGLRRLRNKYNFGSDSVSDLDICLEPLGSGVCQTWEFYKDLPGVGAVTILTVELIWNLVNLLTRPFVALMFGLQGFEMPLRFLEWFGDYLFVEDTVLRSAKIILDFLCICFLFKEKLAAVRVWVVFYFVLCILSNAAASLMITEWCVTGIPSINFVIYHSIAIFTDNIYRIMVLYFTIKYGMVHVRTIAKL